ncbi:hypothetical protein CHS0354_003498 [Potamilus streckersoni]|uniref:RING-type domain-containing protein n=1 Tax=Potamilus streckersoni TaxID=2493646 RepID=A0AAE0SYR4_9BIVA|nr:hypothetical protein CHS0354_003498 [Potamilus streckersoni]
MMENNIRTVYGPCCPLCFEQFNRPRQLPCVHSFCEECLQSQIINENIKDMNLSHVKCPVCGTSTSYTIKNRPISEWASTFPVNTVLPSVKDGLCKACRCISVQAGENCTRCQEAMDQDFRVQKKLKTSKDHTIPGTEKLFCNPENVTKFVEGFTCIEHDGSDIKYYCKDHMVLCCGTCTIQTHKMCSIMLILGEEFPRIMQAWFPYEMISCLELIENDLKTCIKMNISSVKTLEIQNKTEITNIGEARKKINAVLDKLEEQLTREANRIHKEEIDKKCYDNRMFSSHLQALRNSQYLLKAVDKHGSNLHKFLTVEKMRSQLHFYRNLIENDKKADTITEVQLSSPLKSILSDSLCEMAKIVTVDKLNTHPTYFHSQQLCCLLEKCYLIYPEGPTDPQPKYTGAAFLHGDRLMLADYNNKKCILLNSTYNVIASHTLTDNPWNVCALDEQEVAVSFVTSTEIHILSVLDDVIRPIKTISTRFCNNGMAASGKGEMVVNSFCFDQSSCWSIYLRYDLGISCTYKSYSSSFNYIAINNKFTHVYIAIDETNSLLCFDTYGRQQFTYSNAYLIGPRGVAVDRYDNIYVVGFHSCNIHQLSPLGSLLQIITEGLSQTPCAICIDKHRDIPRQLPCAHSFCEECLQSHITTENIKDMKLSHVKCPVCGNSTSYTIKNRPISEWASTFPANTILPSVEDRLCEAFRGISVQAGEYCTICQEAMDQDLRVQKKLKTSTDHTIPGMEEQFCNPENVTKFVEGFTCTEHDGSDIKYYCNDHMVLCCGTCTIQTHKMCSIMMILGEEFAIMLQESKPYEMISRLELIEKDIKCMEMNMPSVKTLEIKNKTVNTNIIEARKKINAVLDKLEEQLTKEVNRIHKEEIDKKLYDNKMFSAHVQSLRNSQYLLKAVDKHGNNLHKFLTVEKMRSQLHFYHNLMREKCKKADTKVIYITLSSPIKSILSDSLSEMGKIVTLAKLNTRPPTCLQNQNICCMLENGSLIYPEGPTDPQPKYTGAAFLHGDRLMLADYNNKKCILLNSTYNVIASHTLTDNPWNVCALDEQEVAVSFVTSAEIHILSVLDDVIRPIKTISTRFCNNGMAASGKGEMVVNSFCFDQSSCWSTYSRYHVGIFCTYNSSSFNYIAINNKFTHVYIAIDETNSLFCFDMFGRKVFTYSNASLLGPRGVAVDRYDNIYVVGFHSCNIHQLSPLGSLLQIITEGIPQTPCAICIDQHRDMLVITNRNALHIYQLKQYIIGN